MRTLPRTSTVLICSIGFVTLVSLFAAQETNQSQTISNNTSQTEFQGASMETTNIGLTAKSREGVAHILNVLLSDEYTLYTKTLNYHWNVRGINFHQFHEMFKEQYEALFDIIDLVAERARALGERSFGSLAEFSSNTQLKEQPGVVPPVETMLKNLLDDHEAIIRTLRTDLEKTADVYKDMGTNNFLTDIMERHEKIAWMIRASVQK